MSLVAAEGNQIRLKKTVKMRGDSRLRWPVDSVDEMRCVPLVLLHQRGDIKKRSPLI